MRVIIIALLAILDGLFLHQWNIVINAVPTSETIKRMCRYGLGVLGTWPIFLWMRKEHGDTLLLELSMQTDHRERDAAVRRYMTAEAHSFIVSFVFVGIGSFIGYIIDSFVGGTND